MYKVGVDNV